MARSENIIQYLNENDKNKVFFFAEVLFQHAKYENLRKEIESRRREIKENQILSHKDIWQGS